MPDVAVPQLTVIEVVPEPAEMDAPLGTVQLYVVAPLTAEIVYVTPLRPDNTEDPLGFACVTVPGVAGVELTVTARVAAELVPQVLPAVTVTFPAVLPQVTVIDVVPWPAVIDAPDGTVHVYVVAPLTLPIV